MSCLRRRKDKNRSSVFGGPEKSPGTDVSSTEYGGHSPANPEAQPLYRDNEYGSPSSAGAATGLGLSGAAMAAAGARYTDRTPVKSPELEDPHAAVAVFRQKPRGELSGDETARYRYQNGNYNHGDTQYAMPAAVPFDGGPSNRLSAQGYSGGSDSSQRLSNIPSSGSMSTGLMMPQRASRSPISPYTGSSSNSGGKYSPVPGHSRGGPYPTQDQILRGVATNEVVQRQFTQPRKPVPGASQNVGIQGYDRSHELPG